MPQNVIKSVNGLENNFKDILIIIVDAFSVCDYACIYIYSMIILMSLTITNALHATTSSYNLHFLYILRAANYVCVLYYVYSHGYLMYLTGRCCLIILKHL